MPKLTVDGVEIEAYRPGGDGPQLVDQFYFEQVFVTGLQTDGSAYATSNSLEFAFGKFNHGHIDQDLKGGAGAVTEAGWDFIKNLSFTGGPSVAPDAYKGKLDDAALPRDVLAGRPLTRGAICRTFSDCTSGPRNGLVSGCFPLDPFYKQHPDAARLKAIKEETPA